MICSPSRFGCYDCSVATMPANSGLLALRANFIHELSCVAHEGTMKYDALAIIVRFYRRAADLLTAAQMKAARALVGMDQKALAEASGVSLPTIQRMEASNGVVRGVI